MSSATRWLQEQKQFITETWHDIDPSERTAIIIFLLVGLVMLAFAIYFFASIPFPPKHHS